MFLLLCGIILAAAVLTFWLYKTDDHLPPGPFCLPVLGYLPWLDAKFPYETLTSLSKKYGDIYRLKLGNVLTIVISDHKLVKQAFMKDALSGRAPLYVTHGIMKGYGLICSEGELWKDQRKFTSYCLKNFGVSKFGSKRNQLETMALKNVQNLIKEIESKLDVNGSIIFDPFEDLRHSVGTLICHLVFGRSWNKDDKLWKWLLYTQEEGTKLVGVSGPLNFLPFLRHLPTYKKNMDFLIINQKKTHETYSHFIKEEHEFLNQLTQSGKDPEPTNFIQAYLLEREKENKALVKDKFYSDVQFYHFLADLFGAGLDTTLTTLRWYILYLATHPKIQDKLFEELKIIPKNRLPSLDDFPSLPYMEASIAETQRIRSVVPLGIPHGALENITIGNYVIPKGAMVVPLQWAIHMDERQWPKPDEFEPARFLNAEGRFFKPEAFIPFQIGKRMCVGDELARIILLLYGSCLIKNFKISCEDYLDLTGECGITLNPKSYSVKFSRRC